MTTKIGSSDTHYSLRRLKPNSKYLDIVKSQIEKLESKKSKRLECIENQDDRTCRMLFNDKQLVGFCIYKRKTQTILQHSDSFKLELLQWQPTSTESDRKELLNQTVQIAQDRDAKHIYIKLAETEDTAKKFFEENGFQKNTSYAKSILLIKSLEKLEKKKPEKRRREKQDPTPTPSEKQETDADHKNKRLRTNPDVTALPSFRRTDTTPIHLQESSQSQPYRGRSYSMPHPQGPSSSSRVDRNQRYNQDPMHHELTLRKMYIHQIRSHQKTVEGRINSGVVKKYRTGDTIRFFYKANPDDDVECRITDIRHFRTFREMLMDSGFKQCVSETRSLDQAERIYLNIPGYAQRAAQHGVVALHLEVMNSPKINPNLEPAYYSYGRS